MATIEFTITGKTALLMHNPAGMSAVSRKVKTKKIPTPEEEAERAAYKTDDGQLFIPALAFRGALISGAVSRKLGNRSMPKLLSGTVFLLQDICRLTDPTTGDELRDYEIDMRRAVVKNNGVIRARPRIEEWATEIEFEYDDELINAEAIADQMTVAGNTIGVLDYRPERGGWFGRFTAELKNGDASASDR